METGSGNLRSRLRERTAQVHLDVEKCRYNRALLGDTLTAGDVGEQLACQRAIWDAVERFARQHLPGLWTEEMSRREAISADIDAHTERFGDVLGTAAAGNDVVAWWEHADPDEAAGFLYVLEGSSLGGLLLVKHLERQGFGHASRHCVPYGRMAGRAVHGFCKRLEAGEHSEERVLHGAATGFRMIGEMLDRIGEATP